MLNHLFQRTFAVAKEVRTHDRDRHAVGVDGGCRRAGGAAHLRQPSGEHILFVGAGEMVELTATHFAAQHPKSITVANRTLERAQALAHRFHANAVKLSELPDTIARYDIVVSCTASSLPIIGLGMIERAIKSRRRKPMFIVDLAVPRDVEPAVFAPRRRLRPHGR